jgi:hypothetical protein
MTQLINRIARWTCSICGHINPEITSNCRMCGS